MIFLTSDFLNHQYTINKTLSYTNDQLSKNTDHLISSIGILVGSVSVYFYRFKVIWYIVILELFNLIFLIIESYVETSPNKWILLIINLWVSCLVGCAYVNTFYNIHEDVDPARKGFVLGMTAIATSAGMILSGCLLLFFSDVQF